MIKVCDAIMGGGKTSAAISMMNGNPDHKYIFITPYLEEATRIRESCPDLYFMEPSDKRPEFHFRKTEHTYSLIKDGRNIATTHQAFSFYTDDMLRSIRDQGYTLIIDESLDVVESEKITQDDIQLLVAGEYLRPSGYGYMWTGKEYGGGRMQDIMRIAMSRELIQIIDDRNENEKLFYWLLPRDLITAFKDVYVLTYLFDGQPMKYFFDIYSLDFENIGIVRTGDTYEFCDHPTDGPDYLKNLHRYIHIYDDDNLNEIGKYKHALSINWFETHEEETEQLKKNITNYYMNIMKDLPSDQRMWGSYIGGRDKLKGKGYSSGFTNFNIRATNKYRTKTCLVYAINVYMNVGEKNFYKSMGADVNEDMYALSTMIQWIWRSAIRDGEEIWVYIPSSRMRKLLQDWLSQVSAGGESVGE